ncbi:hypothetical protein ACL6C3_28765 [Capilliphycus salinus ALCB114379]|uniref:hypothetical protein n=1 Tax=Capilliphycus salinus TaxID=2768948 RepID=UPI0039A6ADF0
MQDKENKKETSKPKENLNEETQDINAIAKGLMVYLSWSMAGLTTPKKPPQP